MPYRFVELKLVIASHNPGKVREINELLAPFGTEAISAATLGLDEPVEDGARHLGIITRSARGRGGIGAGRVLCDYGHVRSGVARLAGLTGARAAATAFGAGIRVLSRVAGRLAADGRMFPAFGLCLFSGYC